MLILLLGCAKPKQDSVTTYSCRSTYQADPFNQIIKDTLLINVTSRQAYDYARSTSVNGWTTVCEK